MLFLLVVALIGAAFASEGGGEGGGAHGGEHHVNYHPWIEVCFPLFCFFSSSFSSLLICRSQLAEKAAHTAHHNLHVYEKGLQASYKAIAAEGEEERRKEQKKGKELS